MKVNFKSLLTLFIVTSSLGFGAFGQSDTTKFLNEAYRVSNSLREIGEYRASVNQFRKVLDIYKEPKKFDYSQLVLTDTVYYGKLNQLAPLFYKDRYDMIHSVYNGKEIGQHLPPLHLEVDSTLLNGFIIVNNVSSYTSIMVYQEGLCVGAETYLFVAGADTNGVHFPFVNGNPEVTDNPDWYGWAQKHNYGFNSAIRLAFFANGDTMSLHKSFSDHSFEETTFNVMGDTTSYSIKIQVGDSAVSRGYSINGSYGGKPIEYWEYKETEEGGFELQLNHIGDTILLEHMFYNKREGLYVQGHYVDCEFVEIKTLWKNDTLIEVLNDNILFLNKNLKDIGKDKFLKKYRRYGLITRNSGVIIEPLPILFETVIGGEQRVLILMKNLSYPSRFWEKIKNHKIRKRCPD
ncbi:MAG: hypothetical protein ACJA1C_002977 [Crocinitomicaceae bacterium]|jgi:hypothetical protein